MGFTFDDTAAAKGDAESIATMRCLIANDSRNAGRIFGMSRGMLKMEERRCSP